MSNSDWESKFSSIVRETESNIERVKNKLGSSRAFTSLSFNTKPDDGGVSLGRSLDYLSQSQHSQYGNSQLTYRSLPATVVKSADSIGPASSDVNYVPLDNSPSLVSLLSDKIDAQNKTIDQLTKSLQKSEEDRVNNAKHVQDLRDEMSRLRGRVAERGVDLATEQKVSRWQREWTSEMQSVQSQFQGLRSRFDEMCAKNSALATALLELQRFVNSEVANLRSETNSLKNTIGTIEADVASMALQRSGTTKHQNSYKMTKDHFHSTPHDVPLGIDAKNSVSFMTQSSPGAALPDTEELVRLRNGYRSLQRKLSDLESHFLTESQFASRNKQTTGRRSRAKLKPSLRRSSESCDQLTSPNTSDFDLSTPTNSATSYVRRNASAQSFDDVMATTDALSDMTSDVDNSTSLDIV